MRLPLIFLMSAITLLAHAPAQAETAKGGETRRLACRAFDPDEWVLLAESTAADTIACRNKLKDEVRRLKCDGSRESFKFLYERDGRSTSAFVYCN